MGSIRRTLLFVPADRPERVAKAATLATDVVVVELEDGVAPENKALARDEARKALAEIEFGGREVALRVNRISTRLGLEDMVALAKWPRKPDLLLLPKVESAGEIRLYDDLLTEMNAGCELLLLIETCRGINSLTEMVVASPRVSALSFAIADLPAEIGCKPLWEPMFHIRSQIAVAGGLGRIPVIDPPYLKLKDEAGLVEECQRVKDMGYTGKICIHPAQLSPVNQAFTPTAAEVERARKIVAAAEDQGKGAIVVDGRLVDPPVVKIAQRVVDTAKHLSGSSAVQ